MFALFFSLYVAMFRGSWNLYSLSGTASFVKPVFNGLGELITSIFNNVDTPMTTLGDILLTETNYVPNFIYLVAFVLALITSIGIVVVATKGIKKLFTVFFYGVR